jgi:hypothetical protein
MPQQQTEIVKGLKYRLGNYKSPERLTVIVIDVDPTGSGMWYDDHQEGGWTSNKGSVTFRYLDPMAAAQNGPITTSLEYAQDHWSRATELDEFQVQAGVYLDALSELIERLPYRGDTARQSQKVGLRVRLQSLEQHVTGMTEEEMVPARP